MGCPLIHIIEDDSLSRDALRLYLGKSPQQRVLWAGSLAELAEQSKTHQFMKPADIILLGQSCHLSLEESLQQLRENCPHYWSLQAAHQKTAIILLSSRLNSTDLVAAFKDPLVRSVVAKSEIKRNIIQCVSAVLNQKTVITKSVAQHLLAAPELVRLKSPCIIGNEMKLDEKQEYFETMLLFAVLGFSREEIAQETGVSLNMVSARIRAGYAQLGVSNRHQAFLALTQALSDSF